MTTEITNQILETTNPAVHVVAMDQIGATTDDGASVTVVETLDQTEDTTDPDVRVVAPNESMDQIGDIPVPDARVVANESMDQTENITNPAGSFVAMRTDGYCHQCRQTKDVYGSCVANGRTCPLMLCRRCLRRRYGEFVEKVVVNNNWLCPKCRGKCNCGICRKLNGLEPTGNLDREVKAAGCDNVCEYLEKFEGAGKHVFKSNAETAIALPQSLGQEKRAEENRPVVRKAKVPKTKPIVEKKEEVKLPQGKNSIVVSGIDLPPQHAGSVLQFLEFCSAFGKALALREGQAESVVQEVLSGVSPRNIFHSTLTEIIIQLLNVIVNDSGKRSVNFTEFDERTWLNAIGECLAKSGVKLDDLTPEMFKESIDPYDELNPTQRFKLLNILCDEALGTAVLRSVIENPEYAERKKEANKRLKAANDKKKQLNNKIDDEMARGKSENNGIPLTVDQNLAILSKMDAESLEVFSELHKASEMLENLRYDDPLRTNPVHVDHENGVVLWKLKSCKEEEPNILLQQLGSSSEVFPREKWFAFTPEQKPDVEKFIIANSKKMIKRRRRSKKTADTEKTADTIDPESEED